MKKFILTLLLGLSFAFPENFINPSEIEVGMELSSKTRMANNEMHHFKLKVLSILKSIQMGDSSQWIVMADIEDELIAKTGVLAGMSGSPVYFGDRLLGAIAMTDSFQKGTIVLIRPITAMMDLVKSPKEKMLSGGRIGFASDIKTPLIASGNFFLDTKDLSSTLGESYQLIQGGVSVVSKDVASSSNDRFEPGDACMVSLISGDLNLAALGTVTYVDKDYILAFGHPMMGLGTTRLPLHLAKVDAVYPKLDLSYKVGSIGKEVGSIVEDRSPGIMGRYGVLTPKTEVKLSFHSPRLEKDFHFKVIKNNDFVVKAFPLLILNSIRSYESAGQKDMYLNYKIKINLDERKEPIEYGGVITYPDLEIGMQSTALVNEAMTPLLEILKNPYEEVRVASADIQLDIGYGNKTARITNAYLEKSVYKPGESVKVFFEMEEFKNGRSFKKMLTFLLPKSLNKGKHVLTYDSGASFYMKNVGSLGNGVSSLNEIIKNLGDERFRNDKLVLSLYSSDSSGSLMGIDAKYSRLPRVYYEYLSNKKYKLLEGDPKVQFYSLENSLISTFYENQIPQSFNIYIEE